MSSGTSSQRPTGMYGGRAAAGIGSVRADGNVLSGSDPQPSRVRRFATPRTSWRIGGRVPGIMSATDRSVCGDWLTACCEFLESRFPAVPTICLESLGPNWGSLKTRRALAP